MHGRYATVSPTLPEFQKVFKAIVPTILAEIPDKAHPVEASLAFYRQLVLAITLDVYQLPKSEFAFHKNLRWATMPRALLLDNAAKPCSHRFLFEINFGFIRVSQPRQFRSEKGRGIS